MKLGDLRLLFILLLNILKVYMSADCNNLNEVVRLYYNFLKFYILKKVQDESISEDIVQEVMLKLIESCEKGAEVANIKAWLFQVSRNTIYDYFQNNKRNVKFQNEVFFDAQEDSVFEFSVYDYIVPMIKFLPEKYALPLYWSDIENLSQIEIAKKLNLSHSAAKMRVQRARKKLRELFMQCCDIDYDLQGNFISCSVKNTCEPLNDHLKKFQFQNVF